MDPSYMYNFQTQNKQKTENTCIHNSHRLFLNNDLKSCWYLKTPDWFLLHHSVVACNGSPLVIVFFVSYLWYEVQMCEKKAKWTSLDVFGIRGPIGIMWSLLDLVFRNSVNWFTAFIVFVLTITIISKVIIKILCIRWNNVVVLMSDWKYLVFGQQCWHKKAPQALTLFCKYDHITHLWSTLLFISISLYSRFHTAR